jgi:hypothetical protein
MDPANYSMRLRQQDGLWHVSVTRRVNHGRGSASLYRMTSNHESETRTYTTARRPLSAKGAWNAADRARSAPVGRPRQGAGDTLSRLALLAAFLLVIVAAVWSVLGSSAKSASPGSYNPQVVPSAQASADCAWDNKECPLGHEVQQPEASNDSGAAEIYTVSADRITVSPTDQLGDPVPSGERYYNVKFTIRGLGGTGGVNDSAGAEAVLTGNDGKTYNYNGDGTDSVFVRPDQRPGQDRVAAVRADTGRRHDHLDRLGYGQRHAAHRHLAALNVICALPRRRR